MSQYLRTIRGRTILIRPTRWNGADEMPPWDCLDITFEMETQSLMPTIGIGSVWHYGTPILNGDGEDTEGWWKRGGSGNPEIITEELMLNAELYRSKPFCKTHKDNPRMKSPLFGCCVVATEALWFLTQHSIDTPHPLEIWKVKDYEGIWHWYLRHLIEEAPDEYHEALINAPDGIFYDATRAQFDVLKLPVPDYRNGRRTALMGWKQSPSKRTLDLIEEIGRPYTTRYKSYDSECIPPDAEPLPPGTLDEFFAS